MGDYPNNAMPEEIEEEFEYGRDTFVDRGNHFYRYMRRRQDNGDYQFSEYTKDDTIAVGPVSKTENQVHKLLSDGRWIVKPERFYAPRTVVYHEISGSPLKIGSFDWFTSIYQTSTGPKSQFTITENYTFTKATRLDLVAILLSDGNIGKRGDVVGIGGGQARRIIDFRDDPWRFVGVVPDAYRPPVRRRQAQLYDPQTAHLVKRNHDDANWKRGDEAWFDNNVWTVDTFTYNSQHNRVDVHLRGAGHFTIVLELDGLVHYTDQKPPKAKKEQTSFIDKNGHIVNLGDAVNPVDNKALTGEVTDIEVGQYVMVTFVDANNNKHVYNSTTLEKYTRHRKVGASPGETYRATPKSGEKFIHPMARTGNGWW